MKKKILLLIFSAILSIGSCSKSNDNSGDLNEIVLVHQLRAKVKSLDPIDSGDYTSHAVGSDLFDCLYRYHYLKRPYQVIPELAADMPVISEDRLTYTIPIRRDIYFHEDKCFPKGKGRKVTARDFIYSWKRLADIKMRSKMWWVFDNRILGLDEFREYSKTVENASDVDYLRAVEGLRAPDDHTIIIKLKRPWPQILYMLAYLPTAVVPQEAVELYGKNIGNHPVGTGAYRLKKWHRGSYIEAVKHQNYRFDPYPSQGEPGDLEKGLLADAGKPMPFVEHIIWRVVEEDQPRWLMFQQGDIDITSIPKDNFGQAMSSLDELTPEMAERNIHFDSYMEPDTFYVAMNQVDPILGNNKLLRLAICHSFDRKKWIDLFFNGRGVVAHGYIPPNMPGYDPNIKKVSNTKYDVPKAKEYLEQAKKLNRGSLPSFKLTMGGTDTTYRQMGQFLEAAMEEIGLDIEVELLDWPTYLEKLRSKTLQIYSAGWIADYPDVENFMQIFYSKNSPWPNSTNYNNPEFDKIYDQISVMPESPRRTELYRQAQRILVDDAPVAFIYHRIWYTMYHDWVGNFKGDAYRPESCGYGLSKFYKIDNEKRKAYKEKYK